MLLWFALNAFATPPLQPDHWVAGEPFQVAASEIPVVVELWATWCGPCRESFPELTKLQHDYAGRLRVVAITDEPPMTARRFYDRNRPLMDFAVASDPTADTVQGLMLGGYGGSGIPSSYLVHEGEVLWGGPPAALRAVVERHLDGKKSDPRAESAGFLDEVSPPAPEAKR